MDVEARVRVRIRDRRWLSGKLFWSPILYVCEGQHAQWRLCVPPKNLTTGSWVRIIKRSSWSRFHPDKPHVGDEGREVRYLQGTEPQ
jgi:hypothetical protein